MQVLRLFCVVNQYIYDRKSHYKGRDRMKFEEEKVCLKCGKKLGEGFRRSSEVKLDGESYCVDCANAIKEARNKTTNMAQQQSKSSYSNVPVHTSETTPHISPIVPKNSIFNVLLTTTDILQGYIIEKYIDVVEIVFIVKNSYLSDSALDEAEKNLKGRLKCAAIDNGGNAVIGISYSYTKLHNYVAGPEDLMISAHGTIVEIVKK